MTGAPPVLLLRFENARMAASDPNTTNSAPAVIRKILVRIAFSLNLV
jgi:hypothetical protein